MHIDMRKDESLGDVIENLRITFMQYGQIAKISAMGLTSQTRCVLIDFVDRREALLAAFHTDCCVFGDQTIVVELGTAPPSAA